MNIDQTLNDDTLLTELGQRIAAARLTRGFTQADLAAAAGVSKRTVERLEDGAPAQLDNFLRCLRALDRLEALNALLPPVGASPLDLLSRRAEPPARARPSRRGARFSASWTWGDEQ